MTKQTFEEIRKSLAAKKINPQVNVKEKTSQVASKVGSAIYSVLPATNKKVDHTTEELVKLMAAMQLNIQDLRTKLDIALEPEDIKTEEVNSLANMYLSHLRNGNQEEEIVEEEAFEEVEVEPITDNTSESREAMKERLKSLEGKSTPVVETEPEKASETPTGEKARKRGFIVNLPKEEGVEEEAATPPVIKKSAIQMVAPDPNWHRNNDI